MKRWVLFVVLLFAVPCAAQTSVSLSWDASPTPGVNYNLYRTKTATGCAVDGPSCVKVNTTAISLLTFTDAPGVSGRWFYVVRAVDADGVESANAKTDINPLEDHLMVKIPPSPASNLRKN